MFIGNRLPEYISIDSLYIYTAMQKQFTGSAFAEHNLNGFLTNKIPGFKKLNWNLVAGASAMWLPKQTYAEWHVGFENIFVFSGS